MKKIKFNVPTKLTFVRLILTHIIIILLIFPFYRVGINFPQFLFKNILIDLRYLISGVLFIIASITDYYDGKRYKAVTDDMYTKGISGYIEK